ncbi:hypothetical protein N7540_002447 [Penicillium herquei]|nr:hypothetical protein N7540_002447 [Penicillium herquei]
MKAFWQVIATPTADTPGTAIYLHYPDKRYIFGQVSEGFQRACTERGAKLVNLNDVFITGRTEWANTGGLIGLILTLADAIASGNAAIEEQNRKKAARKAALQDTPEEKRPAVAHTQNPNRGQLTIHGTTNLTHTLATARRFVFRKGTPVFTKEYDFEAIAGQTRGDAEDPFEKPTWTDHNIKVWALPIRPQASSPTTFNPPTQVRPQSPRKRSLDEFRESDEPKTELDQKAQAQLMRQAIVTDMFNSTWKMDTLIETPLAEVNMPAAMFVRNPETKDMEPYNGPKPGEGKPLPDVKVFVRQPWPGAKIESLPPTSPSQDALSYIVRSHDNRGKFDPKMAKALKVKAGPDYAKLAKGESVQSEDGKTITSDMVLGETRPGSGVAIMDVPSVEYVESLVQRPEWKSPSVTTGLKAFVWILGPGVGDHPKLREFVAQMSHCEHTVAGTDYSPNYLALPSVAQAAVRLARLKGDSYSIPVHDNVTIPQNRATLPRSTPQSTQSQSAPPFKPLDPGFIIDLEPTYKLNTDEVVRHLNTAKTVFRIPKSVEQRMNFIRRRTTKKEFKEELEAFRKELPGGDAEITALGTGSSAPSKYRNVSATLVYVPESGYYLLDCGENTLGQLERVFEPEKVREILQNLRMIWISHLHADHHLGTASLIKAWYRENYGADAKPTPTPETDLAKILKEKRLFLVSDEMMVSWIEEYASVENFGFDKLVCLCAFPEPNKTSVATKFGYRHRHNGGLPFGPKMGKTILDFNDDSSPLTPLLKSATGLKDILTTYVRHCRGALAASFVFPDGFKVSYSGDCRPSDKFASIGQDSTVLIHEATFEDDMVGSALAKRHSTMGEALEVGRRMGAQSVLLTHFSQRYAKSATLGNQAESRTRSLSSSKKDNPAPRAEEDADIPFDDQDEPVAADSGAKLLDDIRFPSRDRPALPRRAIKSGRPHPAVAACMDYLRIKVRDIPIAQAYAPALEKLMTVMERDSDLIAAEAKRKIHEEEEARKAAKTKKFTGKKSQAAAAAATTVAAVAVVETSEEKKAEKEDPKHSPYSASESESGWEMSDEE